MHRVVLRSRNAEHGPVMLAWVHLEGRWRYLPFEELDLQDALADERDEGKQILEQLRRVETSLRALDDDQDELRDWLARLFGEVVESATCPLSGGALQSAYDQSLFLYAFGYYPETRVVMERLLSSFDALAEHDPSTRLPAVAYVRTAALLAMSLARLGDAPASLRVFDGLSEDAARCDDEVQSWVATLRAIVLYAAGSEAEVEDAIRVYLKRCRDSSLRAVEPYRPLVAASRGARARGDHMCALEFLGEAIDEVSRGNPADLNQDGGTLLHDGCVMLGVLGADAEQARSELAEKLLAHAAAGRDLLHPSYADHQAYASLQLCSWIAAQVGKLELAAMAESLLALSALALAGDDLHEAVERLAREASKQRDPGHALGMIQVAVDLGRRYLPADDPLRASSEALLAELTNAQGELNRLDVLDCPKCHDRMRPVAVLEQEEVCSKISLCADPGCPPGQYGKFITIRQVTVVVAASPRLRSSGRFRNCELRRGYLPESLRRSIVIAYLLCKLLEGRGRVNRP